jgi:hypothetical protein
LRKNSSQDHHLIEQTAELLSFKEEEAELLNSSHFFFLAGSNLSLVSGHQCDSATALVT